MKKRWIIFIILLGIFFSYTKKNFCYAQESLNIFSKPSGIEINWKNEKQGDLGGFVLVRKEKKCPKNFFDGDEVYRGSGKKFFDKEVENGEDYCYGLFFVDAMGNVLNVFEKKQIKKEGTFFYFLQVLEQDWMILFGFFVVAILFFVERKFYQIKMKSKA